MADDLSPIAGGDHNPPGHEYAQSVDGDDEYTLGHSTAFPSRNRQRAVSCPSMIEGTLRHRGPSLSPLTSWDDSAMNDRQHVGRMSHFDDVQDSQDEYWQHKMPGSVASSAEEEHAHLGIAIRRTENINVFDDSASDLYPTSQPSSPAESDSGSECHTESEEGVDFRHKRLQHSVEYFQELDDLEFKISQDSMFPFYKDGIVGEPFDGKMRWKAAFPEHGPSQYCSTAPILSFCQEVSWIANETASHMGISGAGGHYNAPRMHHRPIEHLAHLIECRNIITSVWESVKRMKSAAYCDEFISVLVLDGTRKGVARLIRIECSRIEQLAIAFETCLYQVISLDPAMILFDSATTVANEISAACRELLTHLGMNGLGMDQKDCWRCAVHALDMAVLCYAGAHTQFLGDDKVASITLPGQFLEKQFFRFRRRSFSCLSQFLGGQEAWVLEMDLSDTLQIDLPHLCLLTDAVTFGDIWGPMWKQCVLGDEERIIGYSVGNGVILPWNIPSPASQDAIEVRKGEVFCHWMSDKDSRETSNLASLSILHENDTLLIGASFRLHSNDKCRASTNDHRQSLRESGSLSEPGTVRNGRIMSSEIVQLQVGAPYATIGLQREYKRRGRSLKQALIEDWKCRPQSRNVRHLEFKLGLEVSSCTKNARRIRLITLFGTQTMLNHLRNGSLSWGSTECRDRFYSVLQDLDHRAFCSLYESRPGWQTDLGNAIEHCLDALADTGKVEKDLDLLWAPDSKPALKVTLRSSELSWIGFLEDTETSGTLAVLEDKCLELSASSEVKTLSEVKKCSNNHFDPRHTNGKLSTLGKPFKRAVLETSVLLNKEFVPGSLKEQLIRSKRRHGSTPRHEYRWSVSLLEKGDKFWFGRKGYLKAITPLNRGQILVEYRSWDILQPLKHKILDKTIDGSAERKHHDECIRPENGNTRPVHVLIISTANKRLYSTEASSKSSLYDNTASTVSRARAYNWNTSVDAYPRTMASQSDIVRTLSDEWITRTNNRRMAGLELPERSRQDVGIEDIARLVASLTLPVQIEKNEGQIDQDR